MSGRVRAALVECIADVHSHIGIDVLFTRFDAVERGISNKVQRSAELLRALHNEANGAAVVDGRLVAVGVTPVSEQVQLVEQRLRKGGLDVAARQYRQAVDSLTDGRLESSNGQLRSCNESVLIKLATQHARRVNDPKAAADRLRAAGLIDADEVRLLQGLVGMSNRSGAHHGLTNDEEATFRLHTTTAEVRYLLDRIPGEG